MHKDYVLDYTSALKDVIMETESGVGGLTYRYTYGLEKVNVVIKGVPNGAGSVMQYVYNQLEDGTGEWVLESEAPAGNVQSSSIVKLWYHEDRLGSTDFLTDNVQGKVTSFVSYDDWGAPTMKAILKMGVRELDLVTEYTGHPYDAVLSMYFAEARMYDAADRRFVAMDWVRTNNRYAYCGGNPIRFVDLNGAYYIDNYASGKYAVHKDSIWTIIFPSLASGNIVARSREPAFEIKAIEGKRESSALGTKLIDETIRLAEDIDAVSTFNSADVDLALESIGIDPDTIAKLSAVLFVGEIAVEALVGLSQQNIVARDNAMWSIFDSIGIDLGSVSTGDIKTMMEMADEFVGYNWSEFGLSYGGVSNYELGKAIANKDSKTIDKARASYVKANINVLHNLILYTFANVPFSETLRNAPRIIFVPNPEPYRGVFVDPKMDVNYKQYVSVNSWEYAKELANDVFEDYAKRCNSIYRSTNSYFKEIFCILM